MKKPKKFMVRAKVSREIVLHQFPDAVRSFHIKSYKTQLSGLNNASEKMRRFVEIDQPAFTLWWQQEFSELLTRQMALENTYSDLRMFTDAVEEYKIHCKCTHKRAFSIVSKAKADGSLGALMRGIFEEMDRQQEEEESPFEDLDVDDELFQAFLDERDPKFSQDREPSRVREEISIQSAEETTDSYIKKIYRELVRRLHPDAKHAEGQTAEERVLWHELQNAYEWRDLDRIEAIFRAVNGQTSSAINFTTIPIGDIVAMKEALAKKLSALRRAIKLAKKEANWDFEIRRQKSSFLKYLSKSIESELTELTMQLEFSIEKLQKRLKSWSSPGRNKKQKSSHRETQQPGSERLDF